MVCSNQRRAESGVRKGKKCNSGMSTARTVSGVTEEQHQYLESIVAEEPEEKETGDSWRYESEGSKVLLVIST